MVVLCRGNAIGKFPFVMIVYIAERSNTVAFGVFIRVDGFKQISYEITHGFRAIEIAALMYYGVKLLGELTIKRYGEAFHITCSRIRTLHNDFSCRFSVDAEPAGSVRTPVRFGSG